MASGAQRLTAVTGANGFVGQALCRHLMARGMPVRPLVRQILANSPVGAIAVGDISAPTDRMQALEGADCLVHCAARVHIMEDIAGDPLQAYREVNTIGTLALAEQAAKAGVKRFVFLSSIKVNGEHTQPGRPFTAADQAAPTDPYAQSKWEAEQGLWRISKESGLEVVIIRPPLVYGPGVGANFRSLMRLVNTGLPLPLARITNQRSMVGIGNLVDLIAHCTLHPSAAGQTLLVSDGHDVSTADLIRALAKALDRPARLLPIPPSWLRLVGKLTGKSAQIDRLTSSLQIDLRPTNQSLNWSPPHTLAQGLQETALAQHP